MHTENAIVMEAPAAIIFALAADVLRWPQLLPHYRYVTLLREESAGRRRLVKMAARRTGIPVSWTSTQVLQPNEGRILYSHIGGATRGMEVRWQIEQRGARCDVRIIHDLVRGRWWMRLPPVQFIVGRFFVHAIADRTLRGIKGAAEHSARPVTS